MATTTDRLNFVEHMRGYILGSSKSKLRKPAVVAEEQNAYESASILSKEQITRLSYLSGRVYHAHIMLASLGIENDKELERFDLTIVALKKARASLAARNKAANIQEAPRLSPYEDADEADVLSTQAMTEQLQYAAEMLANDSGNVFLGTTIAQYQRALYSRTVNNEMRDKHKVERIRGKRIIAMNRIRQSVKHSEIPVDQRQTCPICYRDMTGLSMFKLSMCTSVPHFFCGPCLTMHMMENTTCPTCRYDYRDDLKRAEAGCKYFAERNDDDDDYDERLRYLQEHIWDEWEGEHVSDEE